MVVFYFDAKWRGTKEKVVLSFRSILEKGGRGAYFSLCSL